LFLSFWNLGVLFLVMSWPFKYGSGLIRGHVKSAKLKALVGLAVRG
jgi:hypothetical protein